MTRSGLGGLTKGYSARMQNRRSASGVDGNDPRRSFAKSVAEPAGMTKRRRRAVFAGIAVVLGVAVAFRLYGLGRLPGINGDEAWYGVQLARLLDGAPFEWRTPHGNIPGPLHSGLLLLLLLFSPRSLTVLRLPSVISSLAQIGLTYAIAKKHFDRPTGVIALLLTASLPINIAYARFGWDPSHSGLAAIVAAHFALSGNVWASALAFVFALLVHPTNVFVAPFLVAVLFGVEHARIGWRGALVRTGLHAALLGAGLAVLGLAAAPGDARAITGDALTRAVDPSAWVASAVLYSRLLSGDSVYQYVVGSGFGAATTLTDLLVGTILLALLVMGGLALRARPFGREAGVVVGWLGSVASFFILVGSDAMRPHLERYAVCLLVPTTLAMTVLLRHALGRANGAVPAIAAGIMATLALAGFGTRYLHQLQTRGSSSHETFWTGPVEPKEEAFRRIAADAEHNGGACIVADSWWVYWPLAFLAQGTNLLVTEPNALPATAPPGGVYLVGFPDGPFERAASRTPALLPRWDIHGAEGRTVLRVWWMPAQLQ